MLNVVRGNILDGAFRALKRKKFDPASKISVVFMDESGSAEGAGDGGGPTREFLRLGLEELRTSRLFVGPDFQKSTQKINNAPTVEKAQEAAASSEMLLSMCGTQRFIRSLDARDRLVDDTLQFYLHHRIRTPLEQLRSGLEKAGVLQMMLLHPNVTVKLFTKVEVKLSAHDLMHLFIPRHSPPGHIRFRKEVVVVGFWRDWLLEVEESGSSVTLEDVLIFSTGLSVLPILGFQVAPELNFLHAEDCSFGIKYPRANTCGLVLSLPVYSSYDNFKVEMEDGIRQCPGFGQA